MVRGDSYKEALLSLGTASKVGIYTTKAPTNFRSLTLRRKLDLHDINLLLLQSIEVMKGYIPFSGNGVAAVGKPTGYDGAGNSFYFDTFSEPGPVELILDDAGAYVGYVIFEKVMP